jgi:hypothetical protein
VSVLELPPELRGICWHGHRIGREDSCDGLSPSIRVRGQPIDRIPDDSCDRAATSRSLPGHSLIATFIEQQVYSTF